MGIQEKLLAQRKKPIKAAFDLSELDDHQKLLNYIKPVFGSNYIKAIPFTVLYDTSLVVAFETQGYEGEAENYAKAIAKKFIRDWGFEIDDNYKKDFINNVNAVTMELTCDKLATKVCIDAIANMDSGSLKIELFSY